MNFYFCETCGKRITDDDVKRGAAKNKQLKGMYCDECSAGVLTMDMNALTGEQAHEILKKGAPQTTTTTTATLPRGAESSRREAAAVAVRARETTRAPASTSGPIIAVVFVGAVIGLLALVALSGKAPEKPRPPERVAEAKREPPVPAPVLPAKPAVVESRPAPEKTPVETQSQKPPPPEETPAGKPEPPPVVVPPAVAVSEPLKPEVKPPPVEVVDSPKTEYKPETPAPVTPAAVVKTGEWRSCFNGKDLTGWTPGKKRGKVAVKDGYMYHVDGDSADVIMAALPPEPVEIALEVYLGKGGNVDVYTPRGLLTLQAKNSITPDTWAPVSLRVSDGKLAAIINGQPEPPFNSAGWNGLKLYFKNGDAEMRVRNIKYRALK